MTKFMTALLLGVGIGILVAPDSGEETRASLAETAEQWKERFNKMAGRAGTGIADLRNLLDKEIEGVSDDVKQRILTILDAEESSSVSSAFKDEFRPI